MQAIKQLIVEQDAIHKKVRRSIKKLERDFKDLLTNRMATEFPGIIFHWVGSMEGGCMTAKWKADAFLTSISVDGTLYWLSKHGWYTQCSITNIVTWVDEPFDGAKLHRIMEAITQETDVGLSIFEKEPYQERASCDD